MSSLSHGRTDAVERRRSMRDEISGGKILIIAIVRYVHYKYIGYSYTVKTYSLHIYTL